MKVPGCGGKKGRWALPSLRTRWPSLYRQTHFLLVFWVFVTVLATCSWHLWSTCWETGTPHSSEQELRPWEGPLSQPVHVGPCWLLSICLLFCCLAGSLWGASGAPSMPRLWTEAVYHPEGPLRGRKVSTCLLGQISRGLWNSHAVYLPYETPAAKFSSWPSEQPQLKGHRRATASRPLRTRDMDREPQCQSPCLLSLQPTLLFYVPSFGANIL